MPEAATIRSIVQSLRRKERSRLIARRLGVDPADVINIGRDHGLRIWLQKPRRRLSAKERRRRFNLRRGPGAWQRFYRLGRKRSFRELAPIFRLKRQRLHVLWHYLGFGRKYWRKHLRRHRNLRADVTVERIRALMPECDSITEIAMRLVTDPDTISNRVNRVRRKKLLSRKLYRLRFKKVDARIAFIRRHPRWSARRFADALGVPPYAIYYLRREHRLRIAIRPYRKNSLPRRQENRKRPQRRFAA